MVRSFALLAVTMFAGIAICSAAPAIGTPMLLAPYANCTEASDNNDCDIPASSDKYQDKLDRDQDGIGCEC